MEEVVLPQDVQINMMMAQQEHLVQQYETLRYLAVKHEQELAVLTLVILLLSAVVALDSYATWKGSQ